MRPKLKNSTLTKFLYLLGQRSDRTSWSFFHHLTRLVYLKIFCPFFQAYLRICSKRRDLSLIPRHSVEEPKLFNTFLSDLDFTLVFDSVPSGPVLDAVLGRYNQTSLWFPFVGEVEVYSRVEWEFLARLKKEYREAYNVIWNVRKWQWQLSRLRESESLYHHYKASRSMSKIHFKLKLPISARNQEGDEITSEIADLLLSHVFSKDLLDLGYKYPKVSGKSVFLGWSLVNVNSLFLALLPDGDWIVDEKNALTALRELEDVGSQLAAVCLIEILHTNSNARTTQHPIDEEWRKQLAKLILQFWKGPIPIEI